MASAAKSPKKEMADVMLKVYGTERQTFKDNETININFKE